jgi:hypothetical protein
MIHHRHDLCARLNANLICQAKSSDGADLFERDLLFSIETIGEAALEGADDGGWSVSAHSEDERETEPLAVRNVQLMQSCELCWRANVQTCALLLSIGMRCELIANRSATGKLWMRADQRQLFF